MKSSLPLHVFLHLTFHSKTMGKTRPLTRSTFINFHSIPFHFVWCSIFHFFTSVSFFSLHLILWEWKAACPGASNLSSSPSSSYPLHFPLVTSRFSRIKETRHHGTTGKWKGQVNAGIYCTERRANFPPLTPEMKPMMFTNPFTQPSPCRPHLTNNLYAYLSPLVSNPLQAF